MNSSRTWVMICVSFLLNPYYVIVFGWFSLSKFDIVFGTTKYDLLHWKPTCPGVSNNVSKKIHANWLLMVVLNSAMWLPTIWTVVVLKGFVLCTLWHNNPVPLRHTRYCFSYFTGLVQRKHKYLNKHLSCLLVPQKGLPVHISWWSFLFFPLCSL